MSQKKLFKSVSACFYACSLFLLLFSGCCKEDNCSSEQKLIMPMPTPICHHQESCPVNVQKQKVKIHKPKIKHVNCVQQVPCRVDYSPSQKATIHEEPEDLDSKIDAENPKELDFDVKNESGKTLYITCFAYNRRRNLGHWRWTKSPVYKLDINQKITIDIETIPNDQDRNHVFGFLGVFHDEASAKRATYELTDDQSLLDLDLLYLLKGKTVILQIEKYGIRGEFFEYDFDSKQKDKEKKPPELDFAVENRTGKTILCTCFVYEKKAKGRWVSALDEKDDMAVWRFDKTPTLRLAKDQVGIVDVDSIVGDRDRQYIRGYLAIFDADEANIAQESTYELLPTNRKLHLGELWRLKNKKISIEIEKYGIDHDFIDFVIKPAKQIDFTKMK